MKVKMLEWYQQTGLVLQPEQEADVSDDLGAWLVENRKAVKLEVIALEQRDEAAKPEEQNAEPAEEQPKKRRK